MTHLLKLFLATILLAVFSVAMAAETEPTETQSARVEVNGMVCAFCAQGIRRTFDREPATADILVSLENRLVAIEFKPGLQLGDDEITEHLTKAGYDVVGITRVSESVANIRAELSDGG